MIKVLLVDDQALLRLGFRMILEAEPDFTVVGEAADGHAAISMSRALQPDVVLMDVRMPGMDGIAATEAIIAAGGAAKVLILTTFDLDQYVYAGLRAGASGFLLKDAPPGDLLAAIRTVAAGDAVLAPTTTRRVVDRFVALLPDADQADRRAAAKSNREIAAEMHLSEGTVKIHVGHILTKLELRDRVHAVVLAYESRLIVPG